MGGDSLNATGVVMVRAKDGRLGTLLNIWELLKIGWGFATLIVGGSVLSGALASVWAFYDGINRQAVAILGVLAFAVVLLLCAAFLLCRALLRHGRRPELEDTPATVTAIVYNVLPSSDASGQTAFSKQLYEDGKAYRDQKDAAEADVRRLTAAVAQISEEAEHTRQQQQFDAASSEHWEKLYYKMEGNFNLVVGAYDKLRLAFGRNMERYDVAEDTLERIGIALQDAAEEAPPPLPPEQKIERVFAALSTFFGGPLPAKRLPRRRPQLAELSSELPHPPEDGS
jgi:hypothetical protein